MRLPIAPLAALAALALLAAGPAAAEAQRGGLSITPGILEAPARAGEWER